MKLIGLALGLVALLPVAVSSQSRGSPSPTHLEAPFSKLPIYFVENRGVCPDEVAYYVPGANKTIFFTKRGITFRLKGRDRGWAVRLEFVGANSDVAPKGADRQDAVFSYFKGPERNWKTGLPTFRTVVYEELWPGVDLVYRSSVGALKYEFLVKPGADPALIRLRYRGATAVEITDAGAFKLTTPAGGFEDARPVAWQEVDGERVPVEIAYDLDGHGDPDGVLRFRTGTRDTTKPLVVDPVMLVSCGYIGGELEDRAWGIAVDDLGFAYVTGDTMSNQLTFPVKVGPDLMFNGGYPDAFVAKVAVTGASLVYCGYIGGASRDWGNGIAVDPSRCAFVTGETMSDERSFPVKVGPDLTYNDSGNPGLGDAFVAKVNAAGTALDYCGYIGGSGWDCGYSIAVNPSGVAFVTGLARSDETTFPVKGGPDGTHNGGMDAFVARVGSTGAGLDFCGYIGGSGNDWGGAIALDTAGAVYLSGATQSSETTFPVKVGPDVTHNGGWDAFVAKLPATGKSLVYCGYIGGVLDECDSSTYSWPAIGIAVDARKNALVTGWTASDERTFPVKGGPDLTFNGGSGPLQTDAFVARVNASGTALDYGGYIGGSGNDFGEGIAVDALGYAYVTGATSSSEQTFPVHVGPDLTFNGIGWGDAFVAKVGAAGRRLYYCGYVGGHDDDVGRCIAATPAGTVYVAGQTMSTEASFPVRVGPDLTYNGFRYDAFVAKLDYTMLAGSGSTSPGGTVTLRLDEPADAGRPFQIGTSLGAGPLPLGTRWILLSPDNLLVVTVNDHWPSVFSGYRGVIDAKGEARATIHIPNQPALIGVRLHSAFVTLDPAAPLGIRSISNTFSFSITK